MNENESDSLSAVIAQCEFVSVYTSYFVHLPVFNRYNITSQKDLREAARSLSKYIDEKNSQRTTKEKLVEHTPEVMPPVSLVNCERPDTWVTVCTGHIGDTSSPRGGSDALEGVFGYG
jgi:hypothetical protein